MVQDFLTTVCKHFFCPSLACHTCIPHTDVNMTSNPGTALGKQTPWSLCVIPVSTGKKNAKTMKQTQCQTFLAMAMLDWKEVLIWDHLLGKYWAHSLAFLFLGLPCCACSSWAATRSSLGNTSAMLAKRCIKSNNFWTSWLQAHLFRHALDFSVGRISWDFFFTSSTRSSHPSTSLMRWCLKSCLHTFKQYWHEPPTKSASRSAPHTLQPATLFTLPPKPRGRSLGGVSNSSSAPSFNGVLTFCLL